MTAILCLLDISEFFYNKSIAKKSCFNKFPKGGDLKDGERFSASRKRGNNERASLSRSFTKLR